MKFAYDIPDSIWSLFRSMNRELYMEALLSMPSGTRRLERKPADLVIS